jgi:hypothetical protein
MRGVSISEKKWNASAFYQAPEIGTVKKPEMLLCQLSREAMAAIEGSEENSGIRPCEVRMLEWHTWPPVEGEEESRVAVFKGPLLRKLGLKFKCKCRRGFDTLFVFWILDFSAADRTELDHTMSAH